MYRTLLGILAVFAVALSAVALTFSSTREPPAELRIANGTEPKSLDPQLITGNIEAHIADALFEGLARYDSKTLEPVPGVAASWDISPDGLNYTFHLREDARWSDGHPLTASDFVYSWKRLLTPSVGAEVAYLLFPVALAEAFNTFEAHAETLEKSVEPALADLVRRTSAPLDAKTWQRFLREHKVNDPLRPVDERALAELLARQKGSVSPAELGEFQRGVVRARAFLRAHAAEAHAHFGVDRGVVARDAHTLEVELRAPAPYFLQLMAHHSSFPVPRWLIEDPKIGDAWFLPQHLVANGPFRLERWVVNDHLRVVRSATYWGKKDVRLASVDFLPGENSMTNLNLYLTGAIDWIPDYFPHQLGPELKKRRDYYAAPGLSVYYYRLNTLRPPLDDRRVRKALNLALDRSVISTHVASLGQVPAATFVPPGLPGYASPPSAVHTDVEEARRLLAEAGFPGGKGFPHLAILYNTSEDHKRLAEVVSDQLRKALGIEVSAYNQEWQSFLDTVRGLDYDIARAGWIGDYADPDTFLGSWVTGGANNQTGYSSELYDRLIRLTTDVTPLFQDAELVARLKEPDAVRALLPAAEHGGGAEQRTARERLRMLLFREAEALLFQDDFPIIPIYFYVNAGLIRERVKGFSTQKLEGDGSLGVNIEDIHPVRDLWVEGPRTAPE
jgi:oligopeptide transport system substrate-binding protein